MQRFIYPKGRRMRRVDDEIRISLMDETGRIVRIRLDIEGAACMALGILRHTLGMSTSVGSECEEPWQGRLDVEVEE